jgi:cytidine deaminase
MKVSSDVQKAYEMAEEARKNAYAVYSKVKVGAAIKVKGSDKIYAGCNVENVVNGASVCAERSAISNLVTHEGKVEIEFVAISTNTEPPLTPCGVCLQVLGEFCDQDFEVYVGTPKKGLIDKFLYKDLIAIPYSALPKVLDE